MRCLIQWQYPDTPMYPIYAYIDPPNHPNVDIYGIHGVFGIRCANFLDKVQTWEGGDASRRAVLGRAGRAVLASATATPWRSMAPPLTERGDTPWSSIRKQGKNTLGLTTDAPRNAFRSLRSTTWEVSQVVRLHFSTQHRSVETHQLQARSSQHHNSSLSCNSFSYVNLRVPPHRFFIPVLAPNARGVGSSSCAGGRWRLRTSHGQESWRWRLQRPRMRKVFFLGPLPWPDSRRDALVAPGTTTY